MSFLTADAFIHISTYIPRHAERARFFVAVGLHEWGLRVDPELMVLLLKLDRSVKINTRNTITMTKLLELTKSLEGVDGFTLLLAAIAASRKRKASRHNFVFFLIARSDPEIFLLYYNWLGESAPSNYVIRDSLVGGEKTCHLALMNPDQLELTICEWTNGSLEVLRSPLFEEIIAWYNYLDLGYAQKIEACEVEHLAALSLITGNLHENAIYLLKGVVVPNVLPTPVETKVLRTLTFKEMTGLGSSAWPPTGKGLGARLPLLREKFLWVLCHHRERAENILRSWLGELTLVRRNNSSPVRHLLEMGDIKWTDLLLKLMLPR